jgi:Cu/Ag efflux pump CusA
VNDEKLRAQKQAVANQVRQAYYSLARTQSAIEVSQKNLELDRALQRLVQQNVEQKTAAVPYGIVGALIALAIMGTPFGFMAFLGIASLIGVIVSHVIVLFDFIEEMHEKGEPLERALVDAGIMRLRPVVITVGATVLALFPLALHGGPLWKPLCYSQIGGLIVATFITLLLVPVFYSIFVLDLKLVKWEGPTEKE